ncbi:hypothetical protein CFC21_066569 [Triticum aestivum]|uniref:RING-type domain-containing protein n=3 Tax=Triticum TaxID=4564 RepID=A0A9R0TSW2_TRITD|nr:hypothetical protein CFC21_066569 [Triticum aestivum]VAI19423.1 unnamed protein product [Triticum turgidum subsp. durum]
MEGAPRAVPSRRGGVTLAEQLAASSNLRDLLKLRDDDGEGDGARPARRRTLLDVIRGPEDDAAPPSSTRAAEPAVTVAGALPGAASPGQGEERRVSLMALLEQAERQWTTAAARAGAWTRVDQEAAAEEGEAGSGRGVGGRCCVCMARRKGAAFVPCGHTFCRACAREVRAGRGRCPLCNAAIREVLNLF